MLVFDGACWCLLDGESRYLMKNVDVCWRMLELDVKCFVLVHFD